MFPYKCRTTVSSQGKISTVDFSLTASYVNGGIPLERNLKAGTLTSLRS